MWLQAGNRLGLSFPAKQNLCYFLNKSGNNSYKIERSWHAIRACFKKEKFPFLKKGCYRMYA